MILWLLLLLSQAVAGWDVDRGTPAWTFTATWQDHDAAGRRIRFTLPDAIVRADLDQPVRPDMRGRLRAMAEAVRAYAKTRTDVVVTARIVDGRLQTMVRGRGPSARKALKEAGRVADEASDRWVRKQGYLELREGLTIDHAAAVNRYAAPLQGVATALQAQTSSRRAYIRTALSMVQSLPYEARLWKGGDPGFRPPLALLGRRRGDCDSKTVLFLALVRAAYPKLPLAVVYVPGHALAAVGLPAERRERTLKVDRQRLVVAEPVGPALMPLGKAKKLARRQVVMVPPS